MEHVVPTAHQGGGCPTSFALKHVCPVMFYLTMVACYHVLKDEVSASLSMHWATLATTADVVMYYHVTRIVLQLCWSMSTSCHIS